MNYDNSKKEFISLIQRLSGSYSVYQIFSDFCEMAAISLYQPFKQSEELENKYLSIIGKYKKNEVDIFPKLLSCVVTGMSSAFGDFLGECYMSLEISNKNQGQFFTPYNISKLMSSLLGSTPGETEYLSEPTVGSGGMIIARADVLQSQGFNFQQILKVQAVDIDKMCFHMCYIHLTLLHIKAEVIWGNSLSLEIFDTWCTPAHILNGDIAQGFDYFKKELFSKNKKLEVANIPLENKNVSFVQGSLF